MSLKARFGHWTPRYLWDRLMVGLFQITHPNAPWLTPQAIQMLDSWLEPGDNGLEFGSGRSTLWFASRVSKLTSVEHDLSWYESISKKLVEARVENVKYLYKPVHAPAQVSEPNSYADVALEFPDGSLDFVLVDGATRSACALASIAKVRPGGIIIVDNVNWALPSGSRSPASRSFEQGPASDEWRSFSERVASWRYIWTSNGVTDTAVFFRSCKP